MFAPFSSATFRICDGLALSPCCLYGSSCCLGCDAKHKLIQSQSQSQTRPMSKPCMGDDTWTSSRFDMDNAHGNTSHNFINHGLLLWNQSREQWIGNKKVDKRDKHREPRLSRNATYENLLGSNKPFAKPVPLSEMVDFLVDVWEQEGLYD